MRRPAGFEGFSDLSGELHCEGVPLSRIAREVGTPTYVYSKNALLNRVQRLQSALRESRLPLECEIYFAVKACSNVHLLRILGKAGCGADIVSGGELFRASVAEISPARVVFSGVGKTDREITEGLRAGIHLFNVESVAELLLLERIAYAGGFKARAALRVNPDVDAKTHPHVSTGLKKNKFGLAKSELREVYRHIPALRHVNVCGLSCHIGSQILRGGPFVAAWKRLLEAARAAPFDVTYLDLGGGLGVPYGREKGISLEDYGRLVTETFAGQPYKLSIQPGRALVGPAAALLTTLVAPKKRGGRMFYVVDAAMNDLLRPALYGATHPVSPVSFRGSRRLVPVDLVGPVCESADTFQTGARLPAMPSGALLAFGNAGAYGMTMSSQYNSRPRAAEVLVDGTSYKIIRSRETYADLIQRELV